MLETGETSRQHALRWLQNHKFAASSLAAAFAALCLAAADALPQAGKALVAMLALAIAGGFRAAYDRLPADRRRHVLSKAAITRRAAVSAGLAIAISCTYWFVGSLPMRWYPDVVLRAWPKLDFIPSVYALFLPIEWQSGFHRYFNRITYCFPGSYWWETMRYLRTAIPAYMVTIFMAFTLARLGWGIRAVRNRQSVER